MSYPEFWKPDVLGSSITSMKTGGMIRYLAKATSIDQLRKTFAVIKQEGLKSTIIGGGSNLIMSEQGLDGVMVQPAITGIRLVEDPLAEDWAQAGELLPSVVAPRYDPRKGEGLLNLNEDVEARKGEYRYLEMGAGVPWGQAVTMSLRMNLSGLQWFARIPCQVGGAAYNNIHGGTRLLSECIAAVKAYDPANDSVVMFSAENADFEYDRSVFHTNGMVITHVLFRLIEVDPEEAKADLAHYLEWTKEKAAVQPSGANCGSVFQNVSVEAVEAQGLESASAAWYVDRCGWKGKQYGGLQVYPGHANFIVNDGSGTQTDFIRLVEDIRHSVYETYGVVLSPEAECIDNSGNTHTWQNLLDQNS